MRARTLHIILPLAGRGSRFANAGFETPKPLIIVNGQPMFMKALSSLDNINVPKRYTFVLRREHEEKFSLSKDIKVALPDANFAYSDEEPKGALVDVMRAKPFLSAEEGVIILDCDLWFHSQSYSNVVSSTLTTDFFDGALLTFAADHPRYSYAKLDQDSMVTQTAEKRVISHHAIAGAYFIGRAANLVAMAEALLAKPLPSGQSEYYISPLFDAWIKKGAKIKAATVDEFASFGTPEELKYYEQNGPQNLA